MKSSRILLLLIVFCLFTAVADAQKRRDSAKIRKKNNDAQNLREIAQQAVVIDESLAVLRIRPSLFADAVQRMRRGRKVRIVETREADGVIFYRVSAPPNSSGWIQSEAVFGKSRRGDDERLARYIQATTGFDQVEIAAQFLEHFPASPLRPAILLLFGDLVEETAARLSRDAARRLDRREMAASGAPLHSFYLNFVSLDRYRKLGIVFLFEPGAKSYHYDGASWKEIIRKYPDTKEAFEAQKRLDLLKQKPDQN